MMKKRRICRDVLAGALCRRMGEVCGGRRAVRDLHRRLGVVVGLAVAVLAYAVVHVHTATGV